MQNIITEKFHCANTKMIYLQVVRQSISRFKPDVPMIKKSIESLIDKQYIERTPTTRDEYVYIA
jgi:cullin 2